MERSETTPVLAQAVLLELVLKCFSADQTYIILLIQKVSISLTFFLSQR